MASKDYYQRNKEEIKRKAKEYYHANKDKVRERQRESRKTNPDIVKDSNRKSKFGISLSEYESRLSAQGGCCEICASVLASGKGAHLDHCHTTGGLRGFLCPDCNLGLGRFKDNPNLLENAIRYLKKYSSPCS